MKKMTRSIISSVLSSTVMIVFFVWFLQVLVLFLSELRHVGEYDYTFYRAMFYVYSQSWILLYQTLPLMGFVGSLVGLARLAKGSELVVMQSSGYSLSRLVGVVATVGFCLAVLVAFIVQWWGYDLSNRGNVDRMQALHQVVKHRQSLWLRDKDRFFYVTQVKDRQHLLGVYEFDLNKASSPKIIDADQVQLQHGKWIASTAWLGSQVNDHVVSKKIKAYDMNVAFRFGSNTTHLGSTMDNYGIQDLVRLIEYYHSLGYDVQQYVYQLCQQVVIPLIMVLMMIMAIPFVLKNARSLDMNTQIFKGVVIAFTLFLFNILGGGIAMRLQCGPIISSVLPLGCFIVMFLFLLRRRT